MTDLLEQLQQIAGDRVSSRPAELCCYSFDASQVRGSPDIVVRPASTNEVSRIVSLASSRGIPVTARGAGTGMAGGAVPVYGGVVLDLSSMNRILEIDIQNMQVLLEPGVIPDRLNAQLRPYGFFFPPDPGSSAMCTIGGMIANNSSGMRCVKYGTTRAYILDLEVVLADGRVINTGSKTLKSSAGYDLTRLMIGSEGTLGVVTGARVKIVPLPSHRGLVMASFPSAQTAGRAVIDVFSHGVTPSACEILDRTTVRVLKSCDPGVRIANDGDVILFEVDGGEAFVKEVSGQICDICRPLALSLEMVFKPEEMEEIWAARRLAGAAVSRLDRRKSRVYAGEDVGVPVKRIPELICKVEEITQRLDIPAMKYGHIGDGNLHVALFIDIMDEDSRHRLEMAADEIHRAAIDLGGTVSAEHGIGLAKAKYMEKQWGSALEIMRAVKRALDPEGILNPGKMGL